MVDTIKTIPAGSIASKPSVTPSSTGLSSSSSSSLKPSGLLSSPVAANSSALAPKKAAVKKASSAKKKAVRKTASSAKKIVKTATKSATKTVKAMSGLSSPYAGSKAFESMFKSSESFLNFKPGTQTMEKLMNQSKSQMEKMTQDATNMGRESVEACIKSSSLWMKGCEDLMRTAMSLAQTSAEKQGKYLKEALSSKTLNELAEVQNKIAQSQLDDLMSGATKISEKYVKVLSECVEPINAQASKAVKKVTEAMAA